MSIKIWINYKLNNKKYNFNDEIMSNLYRKRIHNNANNYTTQFSWVKSFCNNL